MLKSMLTAAELGITEWEREALLRVRDSLRDNTLPGQFNIGVTWQRPIESSCGSIGCIGGWMFHFAGVRQSIPLLVARHEALNPLFYPAGVEWGLIGPAEAATAIENFLYTGEPLWRDAAPKAAEHFDAFARRVAIIEDESFDADD